MQPSHHCSWMARLGSCSWGEQGKFRHCRRTGIMSSGLCFVMRLVCEASNCAMKPSHLLRAMQVPMFPPLQTRADMTEQVCQQAVRSAIGPAAADVDIEIRTIRTWVMSALVADRFQVSMGIPPAALAV